jgi:hypothetical protein
MSSHVLIAGPGKSGGSLLMQMFTEMGMDTGYSKDYKQVKTNVGGHYEWKIRGKDMKRPFPYLLKEPQMCTDIDIRIDRLKLRVDHVYVLLRRPGPVANALEFLRRGVPDAKKEQFETHVRTEAVDKIERGMNLRIQNLVHLLAEMDLPVTLVSYPKWAHDGAYGYKKFDFLVKKYDISQKTWNRTIAKCVDPKLVEKAYADFPDWQRSYMREKYGFGTMRK